MDSGMAQVDREYNELMLETDVPVRFCVTCGKPIKRGNCYEIGWVVALGSFAQKEPLPRKWAGHHVCIPGMAEAVEQRLGGALLLLP